jgi:hypothetical protein
MALSPRHSEDQQAVLAQLERLLDDDDNNNDDATDAAPYVLDAKRRQELVQEVDTLLQTHGSPVKPQDVGKNLPSTRWRLAVTTNEDLLRFLPENLASITYFYQPDMIHCIIHVNKKTFFGRKKRKSQRVMAFFNTKDIGRTHYGTLRAASHVNMLQGAVVNAIDFAKTRRDSIQTVYFDRILWMEKGVSNTGAPFSNIYVRQFYYQPKTTPSPTLRRRFFRRRKQVDPSNQTPPP